MPEKYEWNKILRLLVKNSKKDFIFMIFLDFITKLAFIKNNSR